MKKEMIRFQKRYMFVVGTFSLLLIIFCVSYALFTVNIEKSGSLNIIAGNLYGRVESAELNSDKRIRIEPNSIKILNVEMENINNIKSKHSMYYKIITLGIKTSDIDVGYLIGETNPNNQVLNIYQQENSTIITKIVIENKKDQEVEIEIGAMVGLEKPELKLEEEMIPINNEKEVRKDYEYKGRYEEFVVPSDGVYKIELWGASGGDATEEYKGGNGAYTKGEIKLTKGERLYFYVGEKGNSDMKLSSAGDYRSSTTFNAGTDSVCANEELSMCGMSGGGATDVRLVSGDWNNFESLKSRIMVASSGSGGGSYYYSHSGMPGGTLQGFDGPLIGTDGSEAKGGSQTQGGLKGGGGHASLHTNGGFGYGGSGTINIPGGVLSLISSGGSGYYGGGAGAHGSGTVGIGGSGSSFISGYVGCDAIASTSTVNNIVHTGQSVHYSKKIFTNSTMIAGDSEMPNPDSGTMIGNSGHGYAKITLLEMQEIAPEECFTFDETTGTITEYLCGKNNKNGKPYYKNAVIPEQINGVKVVSIGDFAFNDKALNNVYFPSTIKKIGNYSFTYNNLTSLIIPSSVNYIGEGAFHTNKLQHLNLPQNVYIEFMGGAFSNNQLSDKDAFIYNRNLDGSEDKTKIASYAGARRENIIIPSSVKIIGNSAFTGCSIDYIDIPEGITVIGWDSFTWNNLKSIKIPNSIIRIEAGAFRSNQISQIDIPNKYIELGGGFLNNNQLNENDAYIYQRNSDGSLNMEVLISYGGIHHTDFVVPSNVKTIKSFALSLLDLQTVVLPDGLNTIESNAFRYNSLTTVHIPSSVHTLADDAFDENVEIIRN